jgi:hydrogenase-4 component F
MTPVHGLLLIPLATAALTFVMPSNRWRPWLLPVGAFGHLAMVALAVQEDNLSHWSGWLVLDSLGKIFLGLISVLFCSCMVYAPAYLGGRADKPNRILCTCLMAGLAMMTLVTLAHHLGLMWVAVESTTLVSAPLLYFYRNPRSLEATWKYLLVGSVGIALALLGSFFLAYASVHAGLPSSLRIDELVRQAPQMSTPWLHAGFILLLVGYGTKMGLAPMHTWKPDAYGEAPGLVGAILAGCMTNCAFVAILRFYPIWQNAPVRESAREILMFMGLASMGTAAVFMLRQRDFKRMLAYSSVEHMGILVFGIGVGGSAIFATLLHAINNAFTKGVLFLSAGNIHRTYDSKVTGEVTGVMQLLPLSGSMFLAGFLAGTGSPPFGTFISEFSLVRAAFNGGQVLGGSLFLVFLFLVFIGMGLTVMALVLGKPSKDSTGMSATSGVLTGLPILVLMALVLMLGFYIPEALGDLLESAARIVEGSQ